MTRSRKKKREKKTRKNVYIKENQIAYILEKCGGDGNFSPFLSNIIDLYISLSDAMILQELNEENIEKLKQEILDENSRKSMAERKVMEYKEIFEELTKFGRFLTPNLKNIGSTSLRLVEFFLQFDYNKLDENKILVLEKLVKFNNIIEDLKIDYGNKIVEFSGNYPYSLLWYVKIFVLI
ncbi:MAG: hypothetical protein ACTSX4_07580, partial [Candidatus Helarchaeota archaeon]